jgi:mono/diheme cytochrome c family protein
MKLPTLLPIALLVAAVSLTLSAQAPARAGRGGAQAPGEAAAGRGRAPAYPTRAPADPAVIEHGHQIFEANCSFCHGDDARGGSIGPNLVRAQVVLDDHNGELITPIVHGSLVSAGMPKFDLKDSDISAIAAWLHDQPLGNRGAATTLDILVGNAAAGKAYFNGAGQCSTCHSVTGDLAGIGGKLDPKQLQNAIVAGRVSAGRGRGGAAPESSRAQTTVTVTLPSGETVEGKLDKLSAFVVALTEANGTHRSFTLNGDTPKVVVHNPLQAHIDKLRSWQDSDIHNLTAYLATLK